MAGEDRVLANGAKHIDFQTDPSRYRHWKIAVDGDVATLTMPRRVGRLGRAESRDARQRPLSRRDLLIFFPSPARGVGELCGKDVKRNRLFKFRNLCDGRL